MKEKRRHQQNTKVLDLTTAVSLPLCLGVVGQNYEGEEAPPADLDPPSSVSLLLCLGVGGQKNEGEEAPPAEYQGLGPDYLSQPTSVLGCRGTKL